MEVDRLAAGAEGVVCLPRERVRVYLSREGREAVVGLVRGG